MTHFSKKLAAIILGITLINLNPAYAQEVVGTGAIDGKAIEILKDYTWRYKDTSNASNSNCEQLSKNIGFCNSLGWKAIPASGAATAMYAIDSAHYAMFIIEAIGSEQGVTEKLVIDAAIIHAASASNVQKNSIPVSDEKTLTGDGKKFTSVGYSAKFNDLPLAFQNNIYVGNDFTVQAIVYGIGDFTQKITDLNQTLLDSLVISP